MKHTPTPWNYNKRQNGTFTLDNHNSSKRLAEGLSKANATHIVQCVNQWQELLEQIDLAITYIDDGAYHTAWRVLHDLVKEEPPC